MSLLLRYGLLGLGVGGIYALAAQGVVLVYRGSRVVNFAVGPMAMVGAFAYYEAASGGWPIATAFLFGVAVSGAVGALTYLLLMRRLTDASPLTQMAAILGVYSLLVAIALGRYGSLARDVEPILPQDAAGFITDIFGPDVIIGQDRLWLLLIGAAVSGICWAVFKYTRFGLITRAVAEKPVAAASVGRSPDLVATINWIAGAGLAGMAGILLVGITGLSVAQFNLILIPALAAALVGRFTSFPLTWIAGVGIGVTATLLTSNADWLPSFIKQPGWSESVPFLVIIGLLVLTGRSLPLRDHIIQRQAGAGTGRVRLWLVACSVVIAMILGNGMGFLGYAGVGITWIDAASVTAAGAIVALSLIVVTGFGGQLSLAQFTLAGVGAFIAARLAAGASILGIDTGLGPVSFGLALVIATAVTVPVGLLVALPALRTRGVNLAIATLGLAVIVDALVLSNADYTGGIAGTKVNSPTLFGIDLDPVNHPRRYTTFCIIILVVIGLVVANLRRSASGRRLLAVRSNERAAASLGISVTGAKLYAFGIAAAIAAVGGVLLAFRRTTITFETFTPFASINLVVFVVIGGIGFIGAALIAGVNAPGGIATLVFNELFGTDALFTIGWGIDVPVTLVLLAGLILPFVLVKNPSGVLAKMTVRWARAFDRVSLRFRRARQPSDLGRVETRPERVTPKTLTVEHMTVSFGAVTAVADVSLVVAPGSVVGLIGPNGAGKTTMLDAVTGFASNQAGSVRLDGTSIDGWSPKRRAQAGLGRSFQSLELFETLTVRDHIRIASEPRTIWSGLRDLVWPQKRPLSPAALAALRELELEGDLARRPEELSHGRRRLLAIARSVAARPSVLLLDEPAAGLDTHESAELGRMIRRLARDWGMAVLLVEHDLSLVMSICDRITVLDFGERIAEGPPAKVRDDPQVIAAYIGVAHVEDLEDRPAVGNSPKVSAIATSLGSNAPAPILEARSLSAGYGGVAVTHGVDLEVRSGEVVALLGANGAGKTTTLLTLAGALPAHSGEVRWRGQATKMSMDRRARDGLVLVPEERSVFMDLTTAENLRVGDGDPAVALELFPELVPQLQRKAGLLSGGQQQMLALARAMASQPEVLMADELSFGLAPILVQRLLEAVRAAADHGAGVLLVEQHAQAALAIADRAYVLRRGEIVLQGDPGEIAAQTDDLQQAYLGSSVPS